MKATADTVSKLIGTIEQHVGERVLVHSGYNGGQYVYKLSVTNFLDLFEARRRKLFSNNWGTAYHEREEAESEKLIHAEYT